MGLLFKSHQSSFPHHSDLSSHRRYTKHTEAQVVAYEEPGNPFTGQECRQRLGKHAPRVACVLNTYVSGPRDPCSRMPCHRGRGKE